MSLNHPGHAIAHSSDKTGAKDKNARFPTSDQPRPAEDPVPKADGTAGMDHVTAVEPKRNARKCQSMINLQRTFDLNHLSRGTPRPDQRGWSIAVVLRACGGRAMLNRGHIKCRKADDQQCHPTPKSEPHSTYISINSTNAPSDNEPPSFVSISGVSLSSLVGSLWPCEEFSFCNPLPSDPPFGAGDALAAGDRREVDLVHGVGTVGAALAGGRRRRTAVVPSARRRVAVVPSLAHLSGFLC